jgi:Fic family protein
MLTHVIGSKRPVMSDEINSVLGVNWNRDLFPLDIQSSDTSRAVKRFQKSLPQFVWEAAQLEGNPFTFPEVQTLLDGVTVGGRKISDAQQILGLRDSMRMLCEEVLTGTFAPTKDMACRLNALIARDEALEWGLFRGEGKERSNVSVNLGPLTWLPKLTEAGGQNLIDAFENGTAALAAIDDPIERAFALKLFMAREQFFFDGNKRTARAMMNGVLMNHGFDGISIPATKQLAYNQAMTKFYPSGDATEMMQLLASCFPE